VKFYAAIANFVTLDRSWLFALGE